MDLLKGEVKKIYFKYLAAAFGGSLISTIYGFVDMIVVGQYQGPEGSAAMAVISPIWNVIYSLGLLFGIGGSIFFSTIRGRAEKNGEDPNSYFTTAMIGTTAFAVLCWIVFVFFDKQVLTMVGADARLLELARQYLLPIKFVIPSYLFCQALTAFLRNDGNPVLVTAAVLTGGIFNIFGDVYFVFGLDMGMFGAGFATAIGNVLSLLIMCTHFFSKRNTLRFVRVRGFFVKFKNVVVSGFSSFFVDVAMGIVSALLNNQIMRYAGTDALAVYGVIIYVSTLVQCCGYSVGQAAQPIISVSLGARKWNRIKQTLYYAVLASFAFGILGIGASMLFPVQIIELLMDATPEVVSITPQIFRTYALSFLLLPLNVFSTYYFQSLMRPKTAFAVSVARGAVVSGGLILFLPAVIGEIGLWLAMPFTELLVFFFAASFMKRYTRELGHT